MRAITVPFMLLAAAGFVLSLYAHVMSLLGLPTLWGESVWFLHVGIFVVWLPAVLVAQRLVRNSSQKDFWKVALLGCPRWMRVALFAIFPYAILNFLYFAFLANKSPDGAGGDGSTIQGFSGHWLIFYGAAFAILYSATHRPDLLDGVKCPSGHDVDPLSKFCGACGAEIRPERADV
jgi:hypothetical protein